ncbi:nitroreductase family protein [Candidatus Bathyarchaeota archaeon]|nr:nitroreductase family protein [Candidatus Bathyarchaeota archaeon]
MSVLDLIRNRGSIRAYKDKPLSKSDLLKVLEAARLAQSAANRQPWQFIVVIDKKIKEKVADIAHLPDRPRQNSIVTAAAVIICLADPAVSAIVGSLNGFQIDSAIAMENMALTAWDMGIGSCCIGAFREDDVKKLLAIPENLRVVSLLTLGYADENPRPKNRKSLDEIIHYDLYGGKNPS